MMYRKAYEKLIEWKNNKEKKALCIIGARQIGKTTVIREFAKQNYKCFVELNFVLDSLAMDIFNESFDVDVILTNLSAYANKKLVLHDTLILFDEIQECPNARTAIKFLVEDGRFDYVESGSLLGVQHRAVKSYPVGFEEIYYMYPMDFEEYLLANNVQRETIEYLHDCYIKKIPVNKFIHETMIKLFKSYIVVGGMPEAVQKYIDTHDIGQVIKIQKSILEGYRLDISKYADNNSKIKIKSVFEAISSQLNDKNRRFMLSHIDVNGRYNRYSESFNWLIDAGVALPCYNVSEPTVPMRISEKRNLFKLFMSDTGLLCADSMGNVQFEILTGSLSINQGSILENIFAEELKAGGFELNYFDTKKYGEVDFVLQNGSKIDLIEIKSGSDYQKHRSLDKVLNVNDWEFGNVYVFCNDNLSLSDKVTYLPWYMIMFYKIGTVPIGTIYEVDISRL